MERERKGPRERRFEPRIAAAAALLLAGSSLATACGDDDREAYVYCVDYWGNVIPAQYCNDNGYYGGHTTYLWSSPYQHSTGYRVPAEQFREGPHLVPNTTAGRAKAGLPRTGRVGGGAKIGRSSGGFGVGGKSGGHSGGG
jgi:hypothetical protein